LELAEDPRREHTYFLTVRQYELDAYGVVNNAVYLNYVEQSVVEHAAALGLTLERVAALGGAFIIRRHTITYHRPARGGDELAITTRVLSLARARGVRATIFRNVRTGELVAEAETEWVWVRLPEVRPAAVPREILDVFNAPAPPEVSPGG
jgi:acyl-CoA thioester hydrolase